MLWMNSGHQEMRARQNYFQNGIKYLGVLNENKLNFTLHVHQVILNIRAITPKLH